MIKHFHEYITSTIFAKNSIFFPILDTGSSTSFTSASQCTDPVTGDTFSNRCSVVVQTHYESVYNQRSISILIS